MASAPPPPARAACAKATHSLLFFLASILTASNPILPPTPPTSAPELGGQRVRTLLFADDTALLSDTPAGLQQLLEGLASFCNENGLTVNVAETEIVLFGWNKNTPPTDHHTFTYKGEVVPISPSFKYLGVVFDQNNGVDTTPHLAAPSSSAPWSSLDSLM